MLLTNWLRSISKRCRSPRVHSRNRARRLTRQRNSVNPVQGPIRSSTNIELLEDRTMLTAVVTIDDVEVLETSGSPSYSSYAVLTVTRTGQVPEDLRDSSLYVRFQTEDLTAKSSYPENDYVAITNGFINMPRLYNGELTQTATILVEINNDGLAELDETFQVKITSVTGDATIGDDTGTVTIIDNDRARVSISDVTVNEGDGTASVTVSLDHYLGSILTVDYTTTDTPTAISPQDYQATSGTVTFQPFEVTKTIQVDIVDDQLYELDKAFYVELSNLQTEGKLTTIQDDRAVVTIQDNDRSFPVHQFDFEEQAKIFPPAGTSPDSDRMGYAIAADGNTLITSAPYWSDPLASQGAAFVYVRNDQGTPLNKTDDTWDYQATLFAPDAEEYDYFGSSIEISGDTAVIGARTGKDSFLSTGAVYVFTRTGTTWNFEQKLLASDNDHLDYFGLDVAIDGETIMVSAEGFGWGDNVNGAVYVFNRINDTWTETQILSNPYLNDVDEYGSAIDFEGSTLVVSSYEESDSGNQGTIYIYQLQNEQWTLAQTLKAEIPIANGRFGYAVSLENNELLIGQPSGYQSGDQNGNAYLYEFDAESNLWVLKQTLTSDDVENDERSLFGSSVLLQDGMMFIGARNYNATTDYSDGALYQYWKEGSDWVLHNRFSTPDLSTNFEYSGFSGNIALADGALFYYDDDRGNNQGSIYSFLSPETPVVSVKDTVVSEGDDGSRLVSIEVTRTGYHSGDLNASATVYFTTVDGTAKVADGRYQTASGSVTFDADPTATTQTQTFTVEIIGDTLVEGDDYDFSVSLYSITGHGRIIDPDAEIIIAEDDQIEISLGDITVDEDAGNVRIPVTLNNPVDVGITLLYETADLSTKSGDFEHDPGTVYFTAGYQNRDIIIPVTDDNIAELTENFQVYLTSVVVSRKYDVIITDRDAEVSIIDNDQATISVEDVSVDESSYTGFIYPTLNIPIEGTLRATAIITNISPTITGGSDQSDYYFNYGTNLLISSGNTSGGLRFQILRDDLVEPDEKFLVTLTNIQINGVDIEDYGIDLVTGNLEAEVTIVDNDQASLSISDTTVNEAEGTAAITVTLDHPVVDEVSIDYATVSQNADIDTDYLATSGTLIFAPGEQSKTINVSIVDSDLIEGEETFLVSLTNLVNNGYAVTLDKSQGVVTIKDDEEAALSIDSVTVNEDAGTATLTVMLNQVVATDVSVDFTTADQTATSTEDYQATSGTLTFTPGDLTKMITVSIVDNPAVEGDESLLVNLSNIQASNANITLTNAQGEILIEDNESATVSIADLSVDESAGVATLTVSLDQPVFADVSIDYATGDQSALQSVDYQNSTGTLTFSAGEQTKTFNISLIDSNLVEADETFLVTLSHIQSGTADVSIADHEALVTIVNDDLAALSISDAVVNEGAGTVDLIVSLNRPVYTSVTVDYQTVGQSADPVDDYLTQSGTLTFDPGEQSKTITVSIVDSAILEGDETFLVNLTSLQSASTDVSLVDNQGEVTIRDDEQATLSIDEIQVNENAGTATLTVTLSHAASIPVSVDFATADQSATSFDDYQATSDTLTFNPGDLTKTIIITLIDSVTSETDETFLVNLSNIQAGNANITFSDDQAEVTIRDDQTTISINDVTVDEDAGTAVLTVSLNHTITENLSVEFTTANQTAKQPDDYQSTTGTLNFNAGDLTKMITIPLVYADSVEKTETFLVNLSNIQVNGINVTFADAQGKVTIHDQDQASLTISDTSVNESAGTVTVTATLDHPVETYLNLNYTTTAGPYATSPDYYEADSGILIFAPGQTTATIEINLVDNSYTEPEVYFYVDLSNLNSNGTAVTLTDDRAKVTIEDNDSEYKDLFYDYRFHNESAYQGKSTLHAQEYVSQNDQFGYKITADGDTLISSAPYLDAPLADQGGVFVYVRNDEGTPTDRFDDTWAYQATLLAPDGQAFDQFGWSLAISGDTAVIGALNETDSENSGAVYIFTRSGTTWTFQQKLTAPPAESNLLFGSEIAIQGNTLVVGSPLDQDGDGSISIYKRVSGIWSLVQSISNPDLNGADAQFGTSIAIDQKHLVIGAANYDSGRGSAYIFNQTGDDQWTLSQKFISPIATYGRQFGISVSIENDLLLIGEPDFTNSAWHGGAHLFRLNSATNVWELEDTITGQYPNFYGGTDYFGIKVQIQDGTLFVAAANLASSEEYLKSDNDVEIINQNGSVTQFRKEDSEWKISNRYSDLDLPGSGYSVDPEDRLARQFAVADGALFISAPLADDLGSNTGNVYHFNARYPRVSITAGDVTEGDDGSQFVTVEVTRSYNAGDLINPSTIRYYTSNQSASAADGDFQAVSGTLYFSGDPTATTQTQTFTVEIFGDITAEADEYFYIWADPENNGHRAVADIVRIYDDDEAHISVEDLTVSEGVGTATVTITLDRPVDTTVSVDYETIDNTARASDGSHNYDYEATTGTATFAPGEQSATISIPINETIYIGDFTLVELEENFLVRISKLMINGETTTSSDRDDISISDNEAVVTIVDDDQATLSPNTMENMESREDPYFYFQFDKFIDAAISLDYATEDGTATSPDDYESFSGTLLINPGNKSNRIYVSLVDNDLVELENRSFWVNLTNLQTNGLNVVLAETHLEYVILNDDKGVITAEDVSVDEGAGTAVITVTLSNPVPDAVTVDFTTVAVSADASDDFLPTSGAITFDPLQQTQTITVDLVDSDEMEPDENFYILLSNPLPFGLTSVPYLDRKVYVTIKDDDQALVSIDDMTVNEDAETVTLTVSLDRPVLTEVSLDYTTNDDSALATFDYGQTAGSLTFGPGDLVKTITVPIVDTPEVEADQKFLVKLTNLQAGGLNVVFSKDEGEVTITDDDQATISIDDIIVDEYSGIATLTVSIDHPVDTSLTMEFATVDETAIQGEDYQSTSGTIFFNPREQTRTISIPLISGDIADDIVELNKTFLVNLTNLVASGRQVTIQDNQARVTIQQDQAAFSISDEVVDETAGTATVTVTLDRAIDTSISVDYATADLSATSPDDYQAQTGTLTFNSGQLSKTITVNIIDTDTVEGDERFLINLFHIQSAGRDVGLADDQGEVTIHDDDLTTVSISDTTVDEDAGTVTLTVSLGQIVTTAVNVDYSTSNNSAVAGEDYLNTSGTLTIDPGNLTGTFTIPIVDNDLVEDEKKFRVNLSNIQTNNANLFFIDAQATVTINDDDQAGIAIDDITVNESDGTATLTVSLDKPVESDVSVYYSTADQNAVQSEDYQSRSGTIIFSAGQQTKTITIPIVASSQVELDETFLVHLSNIQAGILDVVFTDDQGEVTIHDEAQAALSIDDITVDEDAGSAVLTVSLDRSVATIVKVDFATEDQSATNSDDYQATSGQLTFNPGELIQTITIPLINSDFPEVNESFLVNLTNLQAGGANVSLSDPQGRVSIRDNVFAISITTYGQIEYHAQEYQDYVNIGISLNQTLTSPLTIDYTTIDQTATQSEDYQAASGTLEFSPGQRGNYFQIPLIDSDLVEGDESFLVAISNLQVSGYDVIYINQQTEIFINDNDTARVSVNHNPTVNEADGTVELKVTIDKDFAGSSISVDYQTVDQSAEADSDFLPQSGTITFEEGEREKTITIQIIDSDNVEGTETFQVLLSNVQSENGLYVRTGDPSAIISIFDDDQAQVSIDDVSVDEDAGTVTLTASLNQTVDSAFSVDFATAEYDSYIHSAEETDYQSTTGTINFSPNQMTQTITIPLIDDDLVEAYELFVVNLSNIQANVDVILGDAQAEVTINDDDEATLTLSEITVDENAGHAVVTFSLDKFVDNSVRVYYSTADQSAIAGEDYVSTSGSLYIISGNLTQTLTIPLIDSDTVELDETFLIDLSHTYSGGRNIVFAKDKWEVTIANDDQAQISIDDVSEDEAAGTVTVTVSLDQPVDSSVTVDFFTSDQSANSPDDYQSSAGSVIFDPLEQSKTFTIPISDSLIVEGDETFLVNLSNIRSEGRNVIFADNQAIVTIRDELPTISINDLIVDESEGTATLTISLDQAVANLVSVDYATVAHSAIDGLDFLGRSGTLIFQAGEVAKTISVPLIQSDPLEAEETFLVNLTNIQSDGMEVLFADDQAEVTVKDFDRVTVSINDVIVVEQDNGTSYAVFTVTRSGERAGNLNNEATVDFTTLDSSATTEDDDYVASSGTITFSADESALTQTATISIQVNGDIFTELDEYFNVQLSNSSAGLTIIDDLGTATIKNDDQTVISISDATVNEAAGKVDLTLSFSKPRTKPVIIHYSTSPGTAISGVDYTALDRTISFATGTLSYKISIDISDNDLIDFAKTFYVDLELVETRGLDVILADSRGTAIIENDDVIPDFELKSKIQVENEPDSTNYFGDKFEIDGNTLITTAVFQEGDHASQRGAFIYVLNDQGTPDNLNDDIWDYQATLFPPDGEPARHFGNSVAISGDTAVVGAYIDHGEDGLEYSGSVFVYKRTGSTWTFQQKLTASDAAARDHFGDEVAIEGDTIVVSAPDHNIGGAVYVFTQSNGIWTETAELAVAGSTVNANLGLQLEIDNSTILMSANYDSDFSNSSPTLYISTFSDGTWNQPQKLQISQPLLSTGFSMSSFSIDGDVMVIGSTQAKNDTVRTGGALILTRENGVWTESQVLYANEGIEFSKFGYSVKVVNNELLIGSYSDPNSPSGNGAVYIYEKGDQGWSEVEKINAPADVGISRFGTVLGIHNGAYLVGAYKDDNDKGSILVYAPTQLPEVFIENATLAVNSHGSKILILDVTRSESTLWDLNTPASIDFKTINIGDSTGTYETISGTITFSKDPLANSQTERITIPIDSDVLLNLDETFAVELFDPLGTAVISEAISLISVLNEPLLISIDDISVAENAETATVTVSLNQTALSTVSVDYTTADQSAHAPDDYLATSGTLTFNPGEQTKTFTISIIDSDLIEMDETILVNLTNLQTGIANVYIADNQAEITIVDDDRAQISIDDASVSETAGTATLTVTLDRPVDTTVSVAYTTILNSTDGMRDFIIQSGTLNFDPGVQSQTISIEIVDDTVFEFSETFFVELSQLQTNGADVSISDNTGLVEILDDDEDHSNDPIFKGLILKPGTPEEHDHFGVSIAIDGDTMITSTPYFEVSTGGPYDPVVPGGGEKAAYIYVRNRQGTLNDPTDDTWEYQATLTPPPGLAYDSQFGEVVAISGDTAIVSDRLDDDEAHNAGAVYVFTRSGTSWSLEQKLTVPESNDGYGGYGFGESVVIENDTIVVGAIGADGENENEGAVFVFNRTNNIWTKTAMLKAADADYHNYFGTNVAIEGSTIVVGAQAYSESNAGYSGAVYIFTLENGIWEQTQQIHSPKIMNYGYFGVGIALEGDTLVISTPNHYTTNPGSSTATRTGAAYVYNRENNIWSRTQTLSPSNRQTDLRFGNYVAIRDDLIVVGTPANFDDPNLNGAKYLFKLEGTEWVEQQIIDGTSEATLSWDYVITDGILLITANNISSTVIHDGAIYEYLLPDLSPVSIENVTITEGDDGTKLATVQITRRSQWQGGLTIPALIDFSTLDGSATTLGGDYVAKTGTIYFQADPLALSQTKVITIEISGDSLLESDEDFFIELSNAIGNAKIIQSIGTVTIGNDDFASVSIDDVTVHESDQTAELTVSLDQTLSIAVSVDYSTADLAALNTEDYEFKTGTLTFNPGETTQTITIPLVYLDLVEHEESFLVNLFNLQSTTDFITISNPQAKVTIMDDDQATVSIDDVSVDEDTGFATVTVSLDQPVDGTVTLDYTTADQTALAGVDYQTTSGTLSFNSGEQSKTFTVNLIDSDLAEVDKTFLINLLNLQNGGLNVVLPDNQAEVTIVDHDQPHFSIEDVIVNEAAGTADITVTLNQSLTSVITVDFSSTDDSATSPSDYQSKSGTLTFNPGDTTQIIQISIIDSDMTEPDETFLINLTNPQSSVYQPILSDSQAVVTIQDNDPGLLSINDITIDEDARTALLTVSLDHAASRAISVDFATTDDSASSGSDYQSKSGTLTFNPGDTTQTIEITLVDSDLVEADETFLVNLSNLQAAGLDVSLFDPQGVVTIHDDDRASLSFQDLTLNEDAGTVLLTVSLDKPLLTSITVDFETLNGTALANSDFTSTSGTLIFNTGITTQTISLTILDDDLQEPAESFFAKLSSLEQNGSPVDLVNDLAEITILDNDLAKLSINDIEVNEDLGTATLTVSLDRTLTTAFSVDFLTVDGTAEVNSDYLTNSGTLTFNPGDVTKTIDVSIVDSDNVELTETLQVQLTNLQAADYLVSLSDPVGEISILDDDQATLSVDDISVDENSGTAQLTVSLSQPVESTVLVEYATADQTAVALSDYLQTSGTLTFYSGETTKFITVNLVDNDQLETDESLLVNLSQLQSSADVIILDNQGLITIHDEDQATISLQDVIVSETAGKAILTVLLDKSVDSNVTLNFTTIDQSATSPEDYVSQSGILTFASGTKHQTIEIDLVDSAQVELLETFDVQLSNIQSDGLNFVFADDRATITIKDDDLGDYEWKSKLYAEGTVHPADVFGYNNAVDGDTLISGSPGWDHIHNGPEGPFLSYGGAFIYVRNDQGTPDYSGDDTWDYQSTLFASDADTYSDNYGWSVDISGDTAVVGAPQGDGTIDNIGSAYVYTRSNGVWTFQQQLNASDAKFNSFFGSIVTIEGDTIVVGARVENNNTGSAYVFTRVDGVWTETAKLVADDAEEEMNFANTIDIENSTIVVGALYESETYPRSGAVYVFTEQDGVWTQSQKLKDSTPGTYGRFGNSVSLEGDLLLIGAPSYLNYSQSAGKAVLYQRNPENGLWSPLQNLVASDAAFNSNFGNYVEIHNEQIFVSASSDPTGVDGNGAVYRFEQVNQAWVEQQKFSSPDADPSDFYGASFVAANDMLLISARYDDDVAFNTGSLYLYGLPHNPAITIDDVSVTEADDGSTMIIANVTRTATKPGELIFEATVDFSTLDGTATIADGDYENTTGTITFESDPNASSQTQTISIRIYGDTLLETNETFGIQLLNVTGHARIADPEATITIENDEEATISINDAIIDEDAGSISITVSLDHPIDTSISVDYATADQTANSANDYTTTTGTLTFSPEIQSQTIVIPITDTDLVEWDETFLVNLSGLQTNGRNVVLGDAQAVITIHDNDQAAISINDTTINEDAGSVSITVSLDHPIDTSISVDYATADQTANSANDYTTTTGTLTFSPEIQSQTIVIPITDTDLVEWDETFLVNLSGLQTNGRNVVLGDTQAVITIHDNDQAAISINDTTINEDAGSVSITVSLDHPIDTSISVDYATADQTANSANDYTTTTGTLIFSPGDQLQTIVIPITDTDLVEWDETFLVNLSGLQTNGRNVELGDTQAVITIHDDDQAAISINDTTISEDVGTAMVTVTLDLPVSQTISVNYALNDLTALSSSDYTDTSGTLTFLPGDQTKTISISITDTDIFENDEIFQVQLSQLQANGLNVVLEDDLGEVTIVDEASGSAEIQLRVVDTPTITELSGESDTLPTHLNNVSEWDTYWVEFWIDTSIPENQGVFSAGLDFHYDTAFTSATEIEYGAGFDTNQSGTVDDQAGTVTDLYAETSSDHLGESRFLLFARLKFEPLATDQVVVDMDGKSIGPYQLGFEIDSQQVSLSGDVPVYTSVSYFSQTHIWANPFDFNDDDKIDYRDLILLAGDYNDTPSESDSQNAWISDLNQDNKVNYRDLILLVGNYGKNKADNRTITYPANYPEVWNQHLLVNTLTEAKPDPETVTQSAAENTLTSIVEQIQPELDPVQQNSLAQVSIQVVDLQGDALGHVISNTIYIDSNAAGYGWFIDTTPFDHAEFVYSSDLTLIALEDGPTANQVDLWTVIMHELGHILGVDHAVEGVMQNTLDPGIRKLPGFLETLNESSLQSEDEIDDFFSAMTEDIDLIVL